MSLEFCVVVMSLVSIFFFQAEDGIRDIGVTGVQTCALPILFINTASVAALDRVIKARRSDNVVHGFRGSALVHRLDGDLRDRSEERRVGKECRYRCSSSDAREKW